jgi:hypothetical protein
MSSSEQLVTLFKVVKKMRTAQKNFYATPRGETRKMEYLRESKQLERVVDDMIDKIDSKQTSLEL